MKSLVFVLFLCLLCIHSAFADDRHADPKIMALVAAMPNVIEIETWNSMSPDQRESAKKHKSKLAKKMGASAKNCKQLESLIIVGKFTYDYPGILALGSMQRLPQEKATMLSVQVWGATEFEYGGFRLYYDDALRITRMERIIVKS